MILRQRGATEVNRLRLHQQQQRIVEATEINDPDQEQGLGQEVGQGVQEEGAGEKAETTETVERADVAKVTLNPDRDQDRQEDLCLQVLQVLASMFPAIFILYATDFYLITFPVCRIYVVIPKNLTRRIRDMKCCGKWDGVAEDWEQTNRASTLLYLAVMCAIDRTSLKG